eukprot:364646-Chlamydomonas_euryale.AAC.4
MVVNTARRRLRPEDEERLLPPLDVSPSGQPVRRPWGLRICCVARVAACPVSCLPGLLLARSPACPVSYLPGLLLVRSPACPFCCIARSAALRGTDLRGQAASFLLLAACCLPCARRLHCRRLPHARCLPLCCRLTGSRACCTVTACHTAAARRVLISCRALVPAAWLPPVAN